MTKFGKMIVFKQKLGCWLHERPCLEFAINFPSIAERLRLGWLNLHNRHEKIQTHEWGGVECMFPDSSWLTAARVFPKAGGRLCRFCFGRYQLLKTKTGSGAMYSNVRNWSVVIPCGGAERKKIQEFVVRYFAYLQNQKLEVIVVDQGKCPTKFGPYPKNVKIIYQPRSADQPYNKSAAINEGVKYATRHLLLLHDSEIIMPPVLFQIAQSLFENHAADAFLPIRFLFEFDRIATEKFIKHGTLPKEIQSVRQNAPWGSLAVRRNAFVKVGGMNEDYAGWGGEDNDFLDRIKVLNLLPGGFLPAIHLWHPSAGEEHPENANANLLRRNRNLSIQERIAYSHSKLGYDYLQKSIVTVHGEPRRACPGGEQD